jgi:hypothetical protein
MALRYFVVMLVSLAILAPGPVSAQEEVASAIRRYKAFESSTGYYEEYEAKPRGGKPLVGVPGVSRGLFPYSPSAADVRNRSRLADSHAGIQFYSSRRCEDCHVRESKDPVHGVRANLTCRQCHGGEPIAGIDHLYSPLNPIRRHAYVCAKCHEGASASFATYVVHAPNPAQATTKKAFPALFYVFWVMIGIAAATFVVFLPHTVLWGIRELFVKKEKVRNEHEGQ